MCPVFFSCAELATYCIYKMQSAHERYVIYVVRYVACQDGKQGGQQMVESVSAKGINLKCHQSDRTDCKSSEDVSQSDRNLCLMGEAAAALWRLLRLKCVKGWCLLLQLFPPFKHLHTPVRWCHTSSREVRGSHVRHNEAFQYNFLSVRRVQLVRCARMFAYCTRGPPCPPRPAPH